MSDSHALLGDTLYTELCVKYQSLDIQLFCCSFLVQVREKKGFTIDAHKNRKEYKGMEVCGGELLEFIRKNKALSVEFCTQLYQELYAPIKEKIEHEIETYTFQQLEADLQKLNEDYLRRAIGPEKWNVLSEIDKKTVEAQKNNFKKLKGYQKKIMKERQRTKETEIEAKKRNEELEKLQQEAIRENEKNFENLRNMQQSYQNHIDKVAACNVGFEWLFVRHPYSN